ncbi:MAG: glycine zipper family protein [Candidatus Berkelbacteria bacterium]|nr:glycine zipper family protein [Candidatus Berkelbacteria bacterium]
MGTTATLTFAGGAVAGAISGAVGGAVLTGTVKGAVRGAFAGAIMGGVAGHFGSAYSIQRIAADSLAGGISSEIYGQEFKDGLLFGALVSSATYLTVRLRNYQVQKSGPDQIGESEGFRGIEGKLAGERFYKKLWVESGAAKLHAEGAPWEEVLEKYLTARKAVGTLSPLGCLQAGTGCVFNRPYESGGIVDYVLEGYSGVHDTFNQPFYYTGDGYNRLVSGGIQSTVGRILNPLNVILATPIVLPSLVPDYMRFFYFAGRSE